MNMIYTAMPGYLGSQEQVPFVRSAPAWVATRCHRTLAAVTWGDRFIALLSRDPIAGLISRLTHVSGKVAWVRHAGNGILRLDAVIRGGDEHERPTASALLLPG